MGVTFYHSSKNLNAYDTTEVGELALGSIVFSDQGQVGFRSEDDEFFYQCGTMNYLDLTNRGWLALSSSYQPLATFMTSTTAVCTSARTYASAIMVNISSIPYNTLCPNTGTHGTYSSSVSIENLVLERIPGTTCFQYRGNTMINTGAVTGMTSYDGTVDSIYSNVATPTFTVRTIGRRVTSGTYYSVGATCSYDTIKSYVKVLGFRY